MNSIDIDDDNDGPITERLENQHEYEAACCIITARATVVDTPEGASTHADVDWSE